jgi:hypothetical protein
MLYTSMVEASERTQSTSEWMPMGEAGRAPLTKAVYFSKRFFSGVREEALKRGVEG